MHSQIAAIIEARMSSSRLPGKVLLPAAGKPMLHHLITRIQHSQRVSRIILATSTSQSDDVLEGFAKENNILCFRGDLNNVMKRVLDAAVAFDVQTIVEITADCPILDPDIIDQVVNSYLVNKCDYASNVIFRSFPDGMDVQVFSRSVLEKSFSQTSEPQHYEHVTLHIRENPTLFKHYDLVAPADLYWPELGLTLDEANDYLLIRHLIEYFSTSSTPIPSCRNILQYLRQHPEITLINKDVTRKISYE